MGELGTLAVGAGRPEDPMTLDDRDELGRRLAALEETHRRLRQEFQRAATQHARVATLLSACHRLHSTLERAGMLIALHEILVGLVGCEEAAVLERRGGGEFALAACFGVAERDVLPFPDAVLSSLRAGKVFVGVPDAAARPRRPIVCVPLRVDGRVAGAVAIFRLDARKPGLSGTDWDLLELLGAHVATALVATCPRMA